MTGKGLLPALTLLTMLASGVDASAAGHGRPCGPDALTGPLRLIVPQGFAGADFRPACQRHDACYDTLGANKSACDRRYLRDMRCACQHSRYPRLCRCMANTMYRVTYRSGDDAFYRAQQIAALLLQP